MIHRTVRHSPVAVPAACLAAFAFVLLTVPALARPPGFTTVRLTPAQFISNCESMGGKVKRNTGAGGSSIQCTLPSGLVVNCSFSGGEAICQWGRTVPSQLLEDLLGNVPQSFEETEPPRGLTSGDGAGSSTVAPPGSSGGKGNTAPGAGGGPNAMDPGDNPGVK